MPNLTTLPVKDSRSTADLQLRELLTRSIRRSGKSREAIADEMTRILARRITVHQLNEWTAPSHEAWRVPAAYIRAFCESTGDDAVLRFLIGPRLSGLLSLGEVVSRALPAMISRFETRRIKANTNSEEPQELLLFG